MRVILEDVTVRPTQEVLSTGPSFSNREGELLTGPQGPMRLHIEGFIQTHGDNVIVNHATIARLEEAILHILSTAPPKG